MSQDRTSVTEVLSNMVVVQAKTGQEKNAEAALTRLTLVFRNQTGCLQYDCFQSFDNPSRFMLVMQWQDETSLVEHLASEPSQELFGRVAMDWLEAFSEEEYRAFSHKTEEFNQG